MSTTSKESLLFVDPQLHCVLELLNRSRLEIQSAYRLITQHTATEKPDDDICEIAYMEVVKGIEAAIANTSVLIGEKAAMEVKEQVENRRSR